MTGANTEPAAYRTLADRVADAEQPAIWDAFGRDMDEKARPGAADHPWSGFVITLSADRVGTDAALADIIHVRYRQFGGSLDGLKQNAMARDADVYAVRPTTVKNPVEAARGAVVNALTDAANGEGASEDADSE